jgi:cathepsin H
MTDQECQAMTGRQSYLQGTDEVLPKSKDWRDAGVISDVKEQNGCGSCWTFSAVAAMESHYAIGNNLTNDEMDLFSE